VAEAVGHVGRSPAGGVGIVATLRAPVMWFGGKGGLRAKIAPLIPQGARYIEPFAGAASLFWSRPRSPIEVLNDLDGRVVALFRVLQDDALSRELEERLYYTPYSRSEFVRALSVLADPTAPVLDTAWAFFVAQNQGFSGLSRTEGDWGRNASETSHVGGWTRKTSRISAWAERLRGVYIEQRPAIGVIRYWDSPDAVMYCDPPYLPETRKHGRYAHEMTYQDHIELLEVLMQLRGRVVLSGYDSPLYRVLEHGGWERIELDAPDHRRLGERVTEVVWRSPNCGRGS